MSALIQARATNFLNAELDSGGTYTALTGARRLKLIATNGDQATPGTEIAVGGSYTSPGSTITWNAAATATGTYSGTKGNVAWSQTNMPAVTTNGVEVIDSAGTPIRSVFGALSVAKTTALGDTLSFPANSIVLSI